MKIIPNLEKVREECTHQTPKYKIAFQMFSLSANDGQILKIWEREKDGKAVVSISKDNVSHSLSVFDTVEDAEIEIQNIISAFEKGVPVYRMN